jgi:hypothetical protein
MVAAGKVNGRGVIRADSGLIYPDLRGGFGGKTTPAAFVDAEANPIGASPPGERLGWLNGLLDALTMTNRRFARRDMVDAAGDVRRSTPTGRVDSARREGSNDPGGGYATMAQSPEVVERLGPQRVMTWQDDAGERVGPLDEGGLDYGPAPMRVQRPWYSGMRAEGGANSRGTTDTSFVRLRLRPMLYAANVGPNMATRRRSTSFLSPSNASTARIPAVRVPVSSVAEPRGR